MEVFFRHVVADSLFISLQWVSLYFSHSYLNQNLPRTAHILDILPISLLEAVFRLRFAVWKGLKTAGGQAQLVALNVNAANFGNRFRLWAHRTARFFAIAQCCCCTISVRC
jgi:hypothetical protein